MYTAFILAQHLSLVYEYWGLLQFIQKVLVYFFYTQASDTSHNLTDAFLFSYN